MQFLSRSSNPLRWFAPIGLLALGLGLLILNFLFFEDFTRRLDVFIGPHAELSWPVAQGSVVTSQLGCEGRANGEGDWVFTVRFDYHVEGLRYSGEQQLMWYDVVSYAELDEGTQFLGWGCGDLLKLFGATASINTKQEAVREKMEYSPGQAVTV